MFLEVFNKFEVKFLLKKYFIEDIFNELKDKKIVRGCIFWN